MDVWDFSLFSSSSYLQPQKTEERQNKTRISLLKLTSDGMISTPWFVGMQPQEENSLWLQLFPQAAFLQLSVSLALKTFLSQAELTAPCCFLPDLTRLSFKAQNATCYEQWKRPSYMSVYTSRAGSWCCGASDRMWGPFAKWVFRLWLFYTRWFLDPLHNTE